MSRIAKTPVELPKNVKISFDKAAVNVEGPKGKLALKLPVDVALENKENRIFVNRTSDTKQARSDHGTTKRLIENMCVGVAQGHKKGLEIQGVGFRAAVQGNKLVLNVGFSHPVEYEFPKEVKVTLPKPTEISVEGVDKALVGLVAAKIRGFKPPEPYKGKGIRYVGEIVKRKQGKQVTK
ncbi:MAG: 50S ribosomal protein L6 [Candidatus Omnitrophica bacterium]|nr:50S ribosomal protein L6 [Candidatus Omnitrophota bacterium]MDE2008508.1 50S ribosomal protein L6 [Candidatus Omnitrophota bacterium]MDE2213974.1 50S ribosomal protein L6 [Candidatus Omnitrophota bacterium]MDE2231371.1 50S ribosomal protein L6 [Candidatus Omnitrophota bacterium]